MFLKPTSICSYLDSVYFYKLLLKYYHFISYFRLPLGKNGGSEMNCLWFCLLGMLFFTLSVPALNGPRHLKSPLLAHLSNQSTDTQSDHY